MSTAQLEGAGRSTAPSGQGSRELLGLFSPRRLLSAGLTVALALGLFVALAPAQLGGSTSYVITDGISMLPRYHAGDLVLLRQQSSYRVGEVAGYHNPQLGVVVMHRIVAIEGDRYVFKGDNNDFLDSYRPTAAQIVGAEWVHLPGWGNLILALRTPVAAAVLFGALGLFVLWPRSQGGRRPRRRRHAH